MGQCILGEEDNTIQRDLVINNQLLSSISYFKLSTPTDKIISIFTMFGSYYTKCIYENYNC